MCSAAIGVWYWTLRGRFPALVRGAAVFEDLRIRQQNALEIHDGIVQGVAAAKLAVEIGEHDRAVELLDNTLGSARGIITNLLGEVGNVDLAVLRRKQPANPT